MNKTGFTEESLSANQRQLIGGCIRFPSLPGMIINRFLVEKSAFVAMCCARGFIVSNIR